MLFGEGGGGGRRWIGSLLPGRSARSGVGECTSCLGRGGWELVGVSYGECGLSLSGVCSVHFQEFVYWVGVMFVHVTCTQCIVVWLQRIDVWDFVFLYWLHKEHCQFLPGPGFCSTSPLRSSRATSQPAGGRRLGAEKTANFFW